MRKYLSMFHRERIQLRAKICSFGKRRREKTLKNITTLLLCDVVVINPHSGEDEGKETHLWIDYNRTFRDVKKGDTILLEGRVISYRKSSLNRRKGQHRPTKLKTKLDYTLDNVLLLDILDRGDNHEVTV